MRTIKRFAGASAVTLAMLSVLAAAVVGAMLAVDYARDGDDGATFSERVERVFSGDAGGTETGETAVSVVTEDAWRPGPVIGDPEALERWEMTSEEWAEEIDKLTSGAIGSALDGLCVVSRNFPYRSGGFDAVSFSIDDEELFRISCSVDYETPDDPPHADENRLPTDITEELEHIVSRSMADFDAEDYEWPFSFYFSQRVGADGNREGWHQTNGAENPWLHWNYSNGDWFNFVWDGQTRNFAIPGVDYLGPDADGDGIDPDMEGADKSGCSGIFDYYHDHDGDHDYDGSDDSGNAFNFEWHGIDPDECLDDAIVRALLPGIDLYGEEFAECVKPNDLESRLRDRGWIGPEFSEDDWTGFYWADGEPFSFGPGSDDDVEERGEFWYRGADGEPFTFDWYGDQPFRFGADADPPFDFEWDEDGDFQFRWLDPEAFGFEPGDSPFDFERDGDGPFGCELVNGRLECESDGELPFGLEGYDDDDGPFECEWDDGRIECEWDDYGDGYGFRWSSRQPFPFRSDDDDFPFDFEWDGDGPFGCELEDGRLECESDGGFPFGFERYGDDDDPFECEWEDGRIECEREGDDDDAFDLDWNSQEFDHDQGEGGPCRMEWDNATGWRMVEGDPNDPWCHMFGAFTIVPNPDFAQYGGDAGDRDAHATQLQSMFNIGGVGRDHFFASLFPDGTMTEPWITPEVRAELERLLDRWIDSLGDDAFEDAQRWLNRDLGSGFGG